MNVINKINNSDNIWKIILDFNKTDIEKAIKIAADNYYNSSNPIISDEDYDALVERLKILDPKSPLLKTIGSSVKGKKVKLPYHLGSMNKKNVETWINKYPGPYVLSDKIDGISCLINVVNGKINLYTRGNGEYGQCITHLLEYLPIDIENFDDNIAIRGELVISKNKFKKYLKKNPKAKSRNITSGIINTKATSIKPKEVADIDFVGYEVIKPVMLPYEQFKYMENVLNITVSNYKLVYNISIKYLDKLLKIRKEKSPYDIDGIIITDNNKHKRNTSGNPDYSFAYKGVSEPKNTIVTDIIWTPSKDGNIIPRINYQQVRLAGADLDYATGFNARYIVNNNITRGTKITVIRSGDTIPHIINITPNKKPLILPEEDYDWDNNEVHFVLTDIDTNDTVIIKRLTKFLTDIGVTDVSIGTVTTLFNYGYDDIFKIINITVDDLLEIPGIRERKAEKIYNNINDALSKITLLKLMVSSNMLGRNMGSRKLKKILDTYPDIVDKYDKKKYNYWRNKILELEGFSDISTEIFLDNLPKFIKFYKKFIKQIRVEKHITTKNVNGKFKNMTIVFTGFRNKDWADFIEKNGGKISSSISKNTSLLVYKGDVAHAKKKKADELGIPVIEIDKFAKKYKL